LTSIVNPVSLSGLTQALFVMEGVVKGHTEDQMAVVFHDDKHLVSMWILFLEDNHWIEQGLNGWAVTPTGQMWSKNISESATN